MAQMSLVLNSWFMRIRLWLSIYVFLFRSMVMHWFVPDKFGAGLIVPLVNDKTGDIINVSNYRVITLITVISKFF